MYKLLEGLKHNDIIAKKRSHSYSWHFSKFFIHKLGKMANIIKSKQVVELRREIFDNFITLNTAVSS